MVEQSRSSWGLSRYSIAGAFLGLGVVAIIGVLVMSSSSGSSHGSKALTVHISGTRHPGTGVTETSVRLSGKGLPHTKTKRAGSSTGLAATGGPEGETLSEVRDPEEAKSFPLPASVHHRSASTPSVAGEAAVAPGAASDAEIRKELSEEAVAQSREQKAHKLELTPEKGGFSVGGNGTIPIPQNVPEAVQRVIAGGNAIADFPYIWGGGHASFVANGYDCSGSVSYALAAGGLLSSPLVSGDLAHWGDPGAGKWITIYANAGHTFMDVDGVWFDTAGRSGPYSSRWLLETPPLEGYAVRHPPGL
jgi:cell wall-associated NlpC family hydrolase